MYIRGQVKHNIIKDQYIRGICMNDCGGFCLELSTAGSENYWKGDRSGKGGNITCTAANKFCTILLRLEKRAVKSYLACVTEINA